MSTESQAPYPWEEDRELLQVETPEQTRLDLRVAGFGARMLAALVDYLIVMGLIVLLVLLGGVGVSVMGLDVTGFLVAAVWVAVFVLQLFYFMWAEMRMDGQSIGKKRLGLRTVMATGQTVTPGASLIRNTARVVDMIPVLWLVAAFTPGTRRLGDILAGTYVIQESTRKTAGPTRKAWFSSLAEDHDEVPDRQFLFSAQVAEKLFPEDYNLLEYMGEQLQSTDRKGRRAHMAVIARKYVERLQLENDRARIEADPERFLQELALFLKKRFEQPLF